MTGMIAMLSVPALFLVIWVIRTNAKDRKRFEEELRQDLDGEPRE